MCCEAQAKVEAKLRRGIFLSFICFGHRWQTIGRKLRTKATKHCTIVGLLCAENAHSMVYCTVYTERAPKRQQFHVAPGMQQPSSAVSTSLRWIFKNVQLLIQNRIRQERSESARELRTAPYKSDQQRREHSTVPKCYVCKGDSYVHT